MLVVNFFGVPCAGKSTAAAYVFARLKMKGLNVELITEFAKDKVWENSVEVFKNQAYMFGQQSLRMSRCRDKLDCLITDSPLPLSLIYNSDPVLGDSFNQTVINVFNSYDNVNYMLVRTRDYNPVGRHQTEEEAEELKAPLEKILKGNGIEYREYPGDIFYYDMIVDEISDILTGKRLASEAVSTTPTYG